MFKNKLRLLGMSTLVGAGLLASGPASAYEMRLGDVDIEVSTIGSVGLSVRTANRNKRFLPAGNGGYLDERVVNGADEECGFTHSVQQLDADILDTNCYDSVGADNYDGSINTDDGRLNFDQGDLTGGTFKATSDISMSSGNISAFVRVNAFYDAVLADDGSYERGNLNSEADDEVIGNIDLLDAYISADLEVAGNPLMVRAGKQVINWGESTFFLGGNSVFNSINVSALRRPGAEIKEALLPVHAIYGSLALPYDITIEAYYGGWDKFQIDAGGAPFAGSDFINVEAAGTATNGNNGRIFIGGGPDAGGNLMNCNLEATLEAEMDNTGGIIEAIRANGAGGVQLCTEASYGHFNKNLALGQVEASRDSYGYDDANWDAFENSSMSEESFGVAARWYSEALNSTEFGFYYQNYTSRIPYFGVKGLGAQIGITTVAPNANNITRQLVASGQYAYCDQALNAFSPVTATIGNSIEDAIKDPYNLFGALKDYVNAQIDDEGDEFGNSFIDLMNVNCALSPWDDNPVTASPVTGTPTAQKGTGLGQSATSGMLDLALAGFGTFVTTSEHANTGTMSLDISPIARGMVSYPEDIEVVGMSFNTTVLGWGLQGEIAYRHNAPLQLDGDALVISAFTSSCVFESLGAVGLAVYKDKRSMPGVDCNRENPGVFEEAGYVRESVINFDIGTTATFTRSNPIIAALGADIGVLLTEFGFVYMDDMDKYRKADNDVLKKAGETRPYGRLAGACTSGSDLGLGSLVGLDERPDNLCRPTSASSGGLLLGQLTYNNVAGTAVSLTPRVIYSRGIHGISPRPIGSFTQGVGTLGLALGFEYQDWAGSIGYTDYQDIHEGLYSNQIDRDTLSVSVSRSF